MIIWWLSSICPAAVSGVCQQIALTTSPLLLGRISPNFTWRILGWSSINDVQRFQFHSEFWMPWQSKGKTLKIKNYLANLKINFVQMVQGWPSTKIIQIITGGSKGGWVAGGPVRPKVFGSSLYIRFPHKSCQVYNKIIFWLYIFSIQFSPLIFWSLHGYRFFTDLKSWSVVSNWVSCAIDKQVKLAS